MHILRLPNSKTIGQTRTLTQIIQDWSSIQQLASHDMKKKFACCNLELEKALIDVPSFLQSNTKMENMLTSSTT